MPATYEPIATTTLSSATATITFSSIPATYTDLRLIIVGNSTLAAAAADLRFNSDTASNYSTTYLLGDGASATSARASNQTKMFFWGYTTGLSATIPSMGQADIFSYAGSTNKTVLMTDSTDKNGSGGIAKLVGLWRSTAAINRIDLIMSGTTFVAGTTATLYGILKA